MDKLFNKEDILINNRIPNEYICNINSLTTFKKIILKCSKTSIKFLKLPADTDIVSVFINNNQISLFLDKDPMLSIMLGKENFFDVKNPDLQKEYEVTNKFLLDFLLQVEGDELTFCNSVNEPDHFTLITYPLIHVILGKDSSFSFHILCNNENMRANRLFFDINSPTKLIMTDSNHNSDNYIFEFDKVYANRLVYDELIKQALPSLATGKDKEYYYYSTYIGSIKDKKIFINTNELDQINCLDYTLDYLNIK